MKKIKMRLLEKEKIKKTKIKIDDICIIYN
jgi:hypothetical protein